MAWSLPLFTNGSAVVIGGGLVQGFKGRGACQDGQMMLAVSGAPRSDIVLGGGQFTAQGNGVMIGGAIGCASRLAGQGHSVEFIGKPHEFVSLLAKASGR